jgi:hypothetical protein
VFDKYPFILTPVKDASGAIVGARFGREGGKEISTANGLSNVKQHLADTNFVMLDDADKERLKPRRKKRKVEHSQNQLECFATSPKELSTILAKGCALGCLPLSIGTNPGMIFIMRALHYTAPIPSRWTVSRRVDEMYDEARDSTTARIKVARASAFGPVLIAITDDLWTSRSQRGHVGVNEQFEIVEAAITLSILTRQRELPLKSARYLMRTGLYPPTSLQLQRITKAQPFCLRSCLPLHQLGYSPVRVTL